jgi:hypothetical protein
VRVTHLGANVALITNRSIAHLQQLGSDRARDTQSGVDMCAFHDLLIHSWLDTTIDVDGGGAKKLATHTHTHTHTHSLSLPNDTSVVVGTELQAMLAIGNRDRVANHHTQRTSSNTPPINTSKLSKSQLRNTMRAAYQFTKCVATIWTEEVRCQRCIDLGLARETLRLLLQVIDTTHGTVSTLLTNIRRCVAAQYVPSCVQPIASLPFGSSCWLLRYRHFLQLFLRPPRQLPLQLQHQSARLPLRRSLRHSGFQQLDRLPLHREVQAN